MNPLDPARAKLSASGLNLKRVLLLFVGLYLAASALQFIRNQPPAGVDVALGWHGSETVVDDDLGRIAFRWTRGTQAFRYVTVEAAVLEVDFYQLRPDVGPRGLVVNLRLGTLPLGPTRLRTGGWNRVRYYLPARAAAASLEGALSRGTSLPLQFDVESDFSPADTGGDDWRRLGIAIIGVGWRDSLPAEGLGFHSWESHSDGSNFRWTSASWASAHAEIGEANPGSSGRTPVGRVRILANNPDLADLPLQVSIFWNGRLLNRVRLTDTSWREVLLEPGLPPGTQGILTYQVERTWSPADFGISPDARRLGIGVTRVAWD